MIYFENRLHDECVFCLTAIAPYVVSLCFVYQTVQQRPQVLDLEHMHFSGNGVLV